MSMKGKPNTAQFLLPKDPTAFLEGGEADKAEKPVIAPAAVTPPSVAPPPVIDVVRNRGRVQKIFNLSVDLADRLRHEAIARSNQTGTRVTEKDIVVKALEAFFKDR